MRVPASCYDFYNRSPQPPFLRFSHSRSTASSCIPLINCFKKTHTFMYTIRVGIAVVARLRARSKGRNLAHLHDIISRLIKQILLHLSCTRSFPLFSTCTCSRPQSSHTHATHLFLLKPAPLCCPFYPNLVLTPRFIAFFCWS